MRLATQLATLVVGGTYGVFALFSLWVFRKPRAVPIRLWTLAVLALGCGAWETWAVSQADRMTPQRWAVGVALDGIALGVFVLCARQHRRRPLALAFVPTTPTHLVTSGLYRWVRHPFYSAYLLSYVAGVVLSGNLTLLFCVGVMAGVYGRAAWREEQMFRRGPLGPAYAAYAARTGMFVPLPWKVWAA